MTFLAFLHLLLTVILYISGKVYYDLVSARKHLNLDSQIAICRVEQISPFPYDLIETECLKYGKAELIWAQEEHKNMGAWGFVHPRLGALVAKFVYSFELSRSNGYQVFLSTSRPSHPSNSDF